MLHVFNQFSNNNAAEAENILSDAMRASQASFHKIYTDLVTAILEGGAGEIPKQFAKELLDQDAYQAFSAVNTGDGYIQINLKLIGNSGHPDVELPSTIHVVVPDPGEYPLNDAPFKDPIDFQ